MDKETEKVMQRILENQEIIISQNLFILEFLIGDEDKRQMLKTSLSALRGFESECLKESEDNEQSSI